MVELGTRRTYRKGAVPETLCLEAARAVFLSRPEGALMMEAKEKNVIKQISFRPAIALLIWLMLLPGLSWAENYYVQQSVGSDENSGDAWGTGHALATIQKAINLAQANPGSDNILVAAGTYSENIDVVGHVSLYGGYPSDGGTTREPHVNDAIIDGGSVDRVVTIISVNNVTIDGFVIQNGALHGRGGGIDIEESSSVTINDNTIRNNSSTDDWGGGIDVVASDVTITNNTIQDNQTNTSGGGISFFDQCSGTISGNTITGNRAASGGGMVIDSSDLIVTNNDIKNNAADDGGGLTITDCTSSTISNNTISNNTAVHDGGGIYYVDSSIEISRNFIQNNTTGNWGGGICIYGFSSGDIINNIISGNQATEIGGGISYYANSSARVINNTIANNSAGDEGGGIGCFDYSTSTVLNTILWGNSPEQLSSDPDSTITATYCDIQGGFSGEGNISDDPLFVGNGDYHLTAPSPCIDAGTSNGVPNIDIDGYSRPQQAGYDIGADEYGNYPPTADAGPDQTVDRGDTVTLDSSNSSDPDDGIASYMWTQTAGPAVTLSDATAVQPTFTAPDVEDDESLTFQLTVTDNSGLQDTDTCVVKVRGGEEDGDCFVATSAFGSPIETHVSLLRNFRDTYLLPFKLGRMIVKTYYKYSPQVAHFIAKHDTLKIAVRIGLFPLIAFSYAALHFGITIAATVVVLALVLTIILVSFYRRRMWGHKVNT